MELLRFAKTKTKVAKQFYSFILINMAKTEALYITPEDVLQEETSDFFDFQFKVIAGQPVECTYKGEKIDEEIGA